MEKLSKMSTQSTKRRYNNKSTIPTSQKGSVRGERSNYPQKKVMEITENMASPYARIEVMYPRSKKNHIWFVSEDEISSMESEQKVEKLSWVIVGMVWSGALASLGLLIWRYL